MAELEYSGRKPETDHLEKKIPLNTMDSSKDIDTSAVNSLLHDPKNWWNWGFVYQCKCLGSPVRQLEK